MAKINYQLQLDREIEGITRRGERPTLLLHSCCGPCSTYVLEYLSKYFKITLFYYNPNIYPAEEYEKRKREQYRLLEKAPFAADVSVAEADYIPADFYAAAKGYEGEREGGARCARCFRLRLEASAKKAAEIGAEYFTTTLSVSPYKNAALLNAIGEETAEKYGVKYLFADFKKREGYKRSIELSREYDLYRQHYCGCEFSYGNAEEKEL